jgi:transposase
MVRIGTALPTASDAPAEDASATGAKAGVQLKRKLSVIHSQVEGLLEEGGIQLAAVVSDLGEARGSLCKKKAQLREALAGHLEPVYRLLLKQEMAQARLLWAQVEEVNQALAQAMKEQVAVLHRLSKIPGVDVYAAQELLAEIGPGALALPSADQFASWIGVCPGSRESAGVNYSNRSAKGNRYLRRVLCQIAWAAIHTKETFFASLFARWKPRIEGKGAAWAVAHRICRVIWIMLHNGVDYIDKGAAPINPRTLRRKFSRLVREFGRQGVDVKSLLEQELNATNATA